MEISSAKWFTEMELESAFIDEILVSPFGCTLEELSFQTTYSDESFTSYADVDHSPVNQTPPQPAADRPAKLPKTAGAWSSAREGASKAATSSSSSSHIISFENSNSSQHMKSEKVINHGHVSYCNVKPEMGCTDGNIDFSSVVVQNNSDVFSPKNGQGLKRAAASMSRTTALNAQDHVLAERKRREKLSQRFVALSALIPGLKKMDKATILGDAIAHVKDLQERLKVAEEQAAKSKAESSVVIVKKSSLFKEDIESWSSDDQNSGSEGAIPDIEARISNKDVLLRIHSEKRKGFLSNVLNQIEKLNLTVVNSSFLPFGSKFDITIVAQMNDGFSLTVNDLVEKLRHAFLKFV